MRPSNNIIIGMESVTDIINEWSATNPEMKELSAKQVHDMMMYRAFGFQRERKTRRVYYDLFEFRARGF
jgi:hypothetical protein